jgi:hypothetical protein
VQLDFGLKTLLLDNVRTLGNFTSLFSQRATPARFCSATSPLDIASSSVRGSTAPVFFLGWKEELLPRGTARQRFIALPIRDQRCEEFESLEEIHLDQRRQRWTKNRSIDHRGRRH